MTFKPAARIHTHWQVAQSQPTSQNLPKSMAAPTHGRKESTGIQHCIKAIAGEVVKSRSVHLIKFSGGGQVIALKSATALILDRYGAFQKRQLQNRMWKLILLIFSIPLFAFQCNQGIQYMENTEITIFPKTPRIISDTIDFKIEIKTTERIIRKCNSMTYQLLITSASDKQIIDTFSVEDSDFQKHIKQKLDKNKSFKYLEIKSTCDKKDVSTDFVVLAKIE